MRVMKDHDVRKAEIIQGAMYLFHTKGYLATTINSILERLSIAKGTFYHYFSSKEDVLDAVVAELMSEAATELVALRSQTALSAVDKFNALLTITRKSRVSNVDVVREVARVIYRDENLILRHKLTLRSIAEIAPHVVSIIQQGNAEGVFHVAAVEETAEAILMLSDMFLEKSTRMLIDVATPLGAAAVVRERSQTALDLFERLLGAPPHSLKLEDGGLLDAFCAGLAANEKSEG